MPQFNSPHAPESPAAAPLTFRERLDRWIKENDDSVYDTMEEANRAAQPLRDMVAEELKRSIRAMLPARYHHDALELLRFVRVPVGFLPEYRQTPPQLLEENNRWCITKPKLKVTVHLKSSAEEITAKIRECTEIIRNLTLGRVLRSSPEQIARDIHELLFKDWMVDDCLRNHKRLRKILEQSFHVAIISDMADGQLINADNFDYMESPIQTAPRITIPALLSEGVCLVKGNILTPGSKPH